MEPDARPPVTVGRGFPVQDWDADPRKRPAREGRSTGEPFVVRRFCAMRKAALEGGFFLFMIQPAIGKIFSSRELVSM